MHISELAERHVEIPEQVVQVGQEIMVKVIDIDLDRRRISLSLKQANEGAGTGGGETGEFDPAQYGMDAQYDAEGNYIYPEGFDPESGEWLDGYEKQREEWERQYAEAQARYEAHVKQVQQAQAAEAAATGETSYSSDDADAGSGGTLASDEALAALREKLAGGRA